MKMTNERKTKWFYAFKNALEDDDVEGFFVILDGIIAYYNEELIDYMIKNVSLQGKGLK